MSVQDLHDRLYHWVAAGSEHLPALVDAAARADAVEAGRLVDGEDLPLEMRIRLDYLLGWFHHLNYGLTDDTGDIARSVLHLDRVAHMGVPLPRPMLLVVGDHPDVDYRINLGVTCLKEVELGVIRAEDHPAVLRAALVLFQGDLPESDPRRVDLLHGRAAAYARLHRSTREPEEQWLTTAVDTGEEALLAGPADDLQRLSVLLELGLALVLRFERDHDMADLERALELITAAVRIDAPDMLAAFDALGDVHQRRYRATGRTADLEMAVRWTELALRAGPPEHPLHAAVNTNMSTTLMCRYELTHHLPDLDKALDHALAAVAATDARHPEFARYQLHVASIRYGHYRRTGVLEDLTAAIEHNRAAIDATLPQHPELPSRLAGMSQAYLSRWHVIGNSEDLDRATEHALDALRKDGGNSTAAAAAAEAFSARFAHGRDPEDLALSIQLRREAVKLDRDYDARPAALHNLAAELEGAFLIGPHADRSAALVEGIDASRQAIELTPAGHPAVLRRVLVHASLLRHGLAAGRPVTGNRVRELANLVTAANTAEPLDQITARTALGTLAQGVGEHVLAVELLDRAVEGLTAVVPRASDWLDQERTLGGHTGLVAEAVAAHCAVDDPVGALRVVERGRGFLLTTLLDARQEPLELADLRRDHSELAERFRRSRNRLAAPLDLGGPDIAVRRKRWEEYDEVLAEIRRLPAYADFLRPGVPDLQLGEHEHVVVVNVGTYRSDAVVVDRAGARVVSLPGIDVEEVRDLAIRIEITSHGEHFDEDEGSTDLHTAVLAYLWDHVGEPVLAALSDATRPRVWWLPVGLVSLLPLHAAARPGQPGVLDSAVSSYTPTLRMLHGARRAEKPARRQLVVGLKKSGDLPPLGFARKEAERLHRARPELPELLDDDATPERVLAELRRATWLHLACHATMHPTQPSQGLLHLAGGQTLPMTEIAALRLEQADMVYLSACSTGTTSGRHSDVALTLSTAFQLAGFTTAIASLWPLQNYAASRVSERFYHHCGDHPPAEALRLATTDLRRDLPDRPDVWAAFAHSGP